MMCHVRTDGMDYIVIGYSDDITQHSMNCVKIKIIKTKSVINKIQNTKQWQNFDKEEYFMKTTTTHEIDKRK